MNQWADSQWRKEDDEKVDRSAIDQQQTLTEKQFSSESDTSPVQSCVSLVLNPVRLAAVGPGGERCLLSSVSAPKSPFSDGRFLQQIVRRDSLRTQLCFYSVKRRGAQRFVRPEMTPGG